MIPAKVEVVLDEGVIQKEIQKRLDEAIQQQLWFVDVDKLSQLTCMSPRYLNQYVLKDPRMKVIEIRRKQKRWYPAQKAFETIQEIMSEW